jgi:hypothetical protein
VFHLSKDRVERSTLEWNSKSPICGWYQVERSNAVRCEARNVRTGERVPATAEAIPPEAAYERFGAFGAYYLPGNGAAAFGDRVTFVNVLGDVLRYYAGADLPRDPDDMHISSYSRPYAFRRATSSWLARYDSPGLRTSLIPR